MTQSYKKYLSNIETTLSQLGDRKYIILGHLAMMMLLIFAVVFANDRVLLTDSAYQVFYDINHKGILINDSRYTMVLTQILPWIAIHTHAPLKTIIIVYSVSFVIVGYACFLITAYVIKNKRMAALMLFVLLAIGGTFLHCISESFQLMFYAPMLYAWMSRGVPSKKGEAMVHYAILALLTAITFFIYPVSAVYILFAIGLRVLGSGKPKLDKGAIATLIMLVAYTLLYLLMGMSGHDSEFIPNGEQLRYTLTHFFTLNSMGVFRRLLTRHYIYLIALLIITIIGYKRSNNKWKAIYVPCYALAYFVAAVIIYWEGDSYISRERIFFPLFFIVGLAFMEDELPRFRPKQETLFFVVFSLLVAISFPRIVGYVHRYTPRMQSMKAMIDLAESEGQHKIIVTKSTAEELFPLDIWGLGLETMLLSAQKGAEHTVTIYKEDDDFDRKNDELYNNPDVYIAVNWWKKWDVAELNPYYFQLPKQGYKELVKEDNRYKLVELR